MHPRMEYALTGHFFEDEVYSDGEIVRIERSPSQLNNELADYCNRDDILWWGITKPYTNYSSTTISFYRRGIAPFGDNDWYGVKINVATGETWYKVQDNSYFLLEEKEFSAKAITYDSNGSILGYDYYMEHWTPEEAFEYCLSNNLSYPFVGPKSSLTLAVWIWGVTCDTSGTPKTVKAYRVKQ